jgi:DNA-directed RNA polymerase specialized sigma24 family protein
MKKTVVDFEKIEPHQLAMHDRLRNWSRWVSVAPAKEVSAMFKLYEAPQHWEPKAFRETCDVLDAQHIENLIRTLPVVHSGPLRWFYVYQTKASKACSSMRFSRDTLHRHLYDARQAMMTLLD